MPKRGPVGRKARERGDVVRLQMIATQNQHRHIIKKKRQLTNELDTELQRLRTIR